MTEALTEEQLLRRSLEHLHGPEEIPYGEDELIVVCIVRDGRPYVQPFTEHYFSLGVKHIVFLDNGSTDGTVEALQSYDDVTVLRTRLPYKRSNGETRELLFKQYLISRFGKKDRWCLCVDMDELFDYPYSDVIGLNSLPGYLNSKSYTAVVAQLLDMFSEKPLSGQTNNPDKPLKEVHRFYDISNLRRRSIKEHPRLRNNTYESDEIESFSLGIREALFSVRPYLTKHPLVFLDDRVKPMDHSSHWVNNAKVADFTCVLFHYKFLDGYFREQAVQAVREKHRRRNSAAYEKYLEVLDSNPSLQVKQETAREIEGVNDLLEGQFLVVSDDYVSWVNAEEEKNVLQVASQGEADGLTEAFLESRRQERAKTLALQRLERQLRENQRLRQQVRKLEQQLESVQLSRAWKLIKVLHQVRVRTARSVGRSLF